MESSDSKKTVGAVLIVKADRLYADSLRQVTLSVFPRANVKLASSVGSASVAMAAESFDLLVTGIGPSLGGDMLDLLSACTRIRSRTPRVLVVTTHHEHRVLTALHRLAVPGVFDSAAEQRPKFVVAMRTVAKGEYYWSRSILDRIHGPSAPRHSLSSLLTDSEQRVLSVIGDGSDDMTAARELGLSPATVSSVRRDLHRKLGVQHRGELMRLAAQSGFVHFTPSGVVRTGFAMLTAACQSRKTKRTRLIPV